MSALCYRILVLATAIRSESHRWNPHADVAELVDALVSGSTTVDNPLQ